VLVANARKLRLIYANKRKTDQIDAENLARLARLDPKLLYPVRHRGEESQAHMAARTRLPLENPADDSLLSDSSITDLY